MDRNPYQDGSGERSEIQDLQYRANQTTDASLQATRNMLMMTEETQDVGITTLQMLDTQGEQMDRIEEDMDRINSDMKEAEAHLRGMQKCCGMCICPCTKAVKYKEDNDTWNSNDDGMIINRQPTRNMDDRDSAIPTGGYITKITNDAREDEMEQNMAGVSAVLGNLKNMAIDMGSEIESQNQQIDRINQKAKSNDSRITSANRAATNLLRS